MSSAVLSSLSFLPKLQGRLGPEACEEEDPDEKLPGWKKTLRPWEVVRGISFARAHAHACYILSPSSTHCRLETLDFPSCRCLDQVFHAVDERHRCDGHCNMAMFPSGVASLQV